MAEPKRSLTMPPLTSPALDLGELTQEIDAPFGNDARLYDEPTLTRLDFEDIELALDIMQR